MLEIIVARPTGGILHLPEALGRYPNRLLTVYTRCSSGATQVVAGCRS